MGFSVGEIAAALVARVEGDASLVVARPSHPAEAGPDDLALAMDHRHVAELARGAARAAVLAEGTDWRALGLAAAILVPRPRYAMAGLTQAFAPPPDAPPGVHPAALVAPDADVAPSASVGPFCLVGAGAAVGPRTILLAHVSLAPGARIGADGLVHPGARIGRNVVIGDRAILQPNAVIGSDGFSFVTPSPGSVESVAATGRVAEDARNLRFARIHSLGGVVIGDDVEIGAGTTIDAGTVAPTRIGGGTKIDNLVQVGHNVRVGANCLLCAQVGIAGSSTLGDRVVLGGQSGVADHVRIGDDVVAGAKSGIGSDLPSRSVVLGAPALPRDEALGLILALRRLPRLIATIREIKKRLPAVGAKG